MIIPDPDTKQQSSGNVANPYATAAAPGPSATFLPQDPPPTFSESMADRSFDAGGFGDIDIYVPRGGEEPPPEFTPYEAELLVSGGDIVSHDPHLNEDGEALYRFLLAQAQEPPQFTVHLYGSHTEQKFRTVTSRDDRGHTHHRTETYDETIIDFDFGVDISEHVMPGVIHWSVPDEQPAYRGKMYKEVDVDGLFATRGGPIRLPESAETGADMHKRRKATRQELKSAKAWTKTRWDKGLPPWAGPEVEPNQLRLAQVNVLKSSKTLREWADEYCASNRRFKDFSYTKVVHGWNLSALQAAICAAVKSTYYASTFTVTFKVSRSSIHVRPDSRLSRMLSKTWCVVLLWIFLIYPFVWLYKRFAPHGGGKWEVCGGAYALKQWQQVEADRDAPQSKLTTSGLPGDSHPGNMRLVGMKEGEWFRSWEGTIKRAVTGRLKSKDLLVTPDDHPTEEAMMLDGY